LNSIWIKEITMYLSQSYKLNTPAAMDRVSRARVVAIVLATGMALLIVSMIVLGALVQRGVAAPPEQDTWLGALHLKAFATNDPACANYLLCAPDHIAVSAQRYYTIWVLTRTGQSDWPGGEYETGRRLLLMPLGH
jgi:hypothetical protein